MQFSFTAFLSVCMCVHLGRAHIFFKSSLGGHVGGMAKGSFYLWDGFCWGTYTFPFSPVLDMATRFDKPSQPCRQMLRFIVGCLLVYCCSSDFRCADPLPQDVTNQLDCIPQLAIFGRPRLRLCKARAIGTRKKGYLLLLLLLCGDIEVNPGPFECGTFLDEYDYCICQTWYRTVPLIIPRYNKWDF